MAVDGRLSSRPAGVRVGSVRQRGGPGPRRGPVSPQQAAGRRQARESLARGGHRPALRGGWGPPRPQQGCAARPGPKGWRGWRRASVLAGWGLRLNKTAGDATCRGAGQARGAAEISKGSPQDQLPLAVVDERVALRQGWGWGAGAPGEGLARTWWSGSRLVFREGLTATPAASASLASLMPGWAQPRSGADRDAGQLHDGGDPGPRRR